jgi:3-methyl-2-oxobutanoate hydroxymethyltransferase
MNPKPRMTLHRLRQMHAQREPIAMLTCYDATFARVLDDAGVDVLLVGDSLGMVCQGRSDTLPVSLEAVIYHTECVARGNRGAWIIADMPFGSYQGAMDVSIGHAVRLMQAGAHMVKVEGGGWTLPLVRMLVERGIPVCGHLGFTPQSVHSLGGYRVQARDVEAAEHLRRDALALADAGAAMIVFELMPSDVARSVAAALPIPVIGIGAGSGLGGQVLVLHDMLNLTAGRLPRFVRDFTDGSANILTAVQRYVADVKSGRFPDDSLHGY